MVKIPSAAITSQNLRSLYTTSVSFVSMDGLFYGYVTIGCWYKGSVFLEGGKIASLENSEYYILQLWGQKCMPRGILTKKKGDNTEVLSGS